MHHAIAGKTFDSLQAVPGLSVAARAVQGVHDAVSQGVYAAVRHGTGAVASLAGVAERAATDAARTPQGLESTLRSALNGAFGDALAEAGSALSIEMGLHRHGAPLALTREALAVLRPRVCLFIHGLACDEQSWWRGASAWQGTEWMGLLAASEQIHYAALLEHEDAGVSALHLRYNTGRPIADNALRLAALLDRLTSAAPHVRQLVLIGHSMGGLVARAAWDGALDGAFDSASAPSRWCDRVPLLICLGTPHQGAPLEHLGHLTSRALGLSSVTLPLARVADARSQGIKDLRHGRKDDRKRKSADRPSAAALPLRLRFIAASLGDEGGGPLGAMVGSLLGDGLVQRASAADEGLAGDVQRIELAGLSHMALLNHPRVYAQMRAWLAELVPA
jgi:pimeloyl-ACP methyl ester carboxylesterase